MNAEEAGMSDYLWDGTGAVDAEVARLESLLGGQRHRGAAPALAVRPQTIEMEELGAPRAEPVVVNRFGRRLAAAAMVVLVGLAGYLARPSGGPTLSVTLVSGTPRIESGRAGSSIALGQWLNTDAKSVAKIEIADIGHVTVRPNTKIMVSSTGKDDEGNPRHVLNMRRGRIEAQISAPPRVFLVDMPSARAIDMGCEYSLDVSEDGSGLLRVTLGHVILEGHGRKADVPMLGGMCRTRTGFGPGTPYFDDATDALINALERFDFEGGGAADLSIVLAEARERDALSLWHLLSRTRGSERERVFGRLAALKPLPDSISKEAILALDPQALSRWHEAMRPF